MALAQKGWSPVSIHRVVLAWLHERNTGVAGLLSQLPETRLVVRAFKPFRPGGRLSLCWHSAVGLVTLYRAP